MGATIVVSKILANQKIIANSFLFLLKQDVVDDSGKKSNVKFYAYSTKETISGIIVPTFDMGSDVATAVTHYKWANYGWCALTLAVVALPGFVCGLAITIKGLRKEITAQRIVNYSIIMVALPFLYPFIQVFV